MKLQYLHQKNTCVKIVWNFKKGGEWTYQEFLVKKTTR